MKLAGALVDIFAVPVESIESIEILPHINKVHIIYSVDGEVIDRKVDLNKFEIIYKAGTVLTYECDEENAERIENLIGGESDAD